MERLTTEFEGYFVPKEFVEVDEYNIAAECKDCWEICEKANNSCDKCAIQHCFEKLAAYENAKEQGLLLKLPCKPGDAIYKIMTQYECDLDFECCKDLFFKCEEDEYCEHHHKKHKVVKMAFELSMLDKPGAIFTTKEAAEQALKQIQEETNNE